MGKILGITGGIRIGDAFSTVAFWEKHTQGRSFDLVCNSYSYDAFAWMKKHGSLPIDNLIAVKDPTFPMGYDDRVRFVNLFNEQYAYLIEQYDEVYTFIEIKDHQFMRSPLKHDLSKSNQDDKYITIQYESISHWKDFPELLDISYPLPTVVITEEKNWSLERVIDIVYHSQFHVGIASCFSVIAPMLGVPTIQCHFEDGGENFYGCGWQTNCTDLPNRVSKHTIQKAVNQLFKRIKP